MSTATTDSDEPDPPDDDQPLVAADAEGTDVRLQALTPRQHQEELENRGLQSVIPGMGDRFGQRLAATSLKQRLLLAGAFFLAATIPLVVAALEGNFNRSSLSPDARRDLGYLNQYLIALPASVIMISMYFGQLPKTLFQLATSDTFQVTRAGWNTFCTEANGVFAGRVVTWLPYVVGTGMAVWAAAFWIFDTKPTWFAILSERRPLAGLLIVPLIFVLYYLIAFALVEIVASYLVLKKFFKFPVNIQPLHPDGSGGLAPLGKLSMKFNVGLFFFGSIAALGIYSMHETHDKSWLSPLNFVIAFAYIFGAGMMFFLPLYAAHRHMKAAKNHSIGIINQKFSRVNATVLAEIESGKPTSPEAVAELKSLHEIHDMVNRMPVLPFDVRTVSSFFGTIVSAPLSVAAITTWVYPQIAKLFKLSDTAPPP